MPSDRLQSLSNEIGDILTSINNISEELSDQDILIPFSPDVVATWYEMLNVVDYAVSRSYLLDSGCCTR